MSSRLLFGEDLNISLPTSSTSLPQPHNPTTPAFTASTTPQPQPSPPVVAAPAFTAGRRRRSRRRRRFPSQIQPPSTFDLRRSPFDLRPSQIPVRPSTFDRQASNMVIPPPVKAQRITNYLKPYLLKMHFSNKYVSAQVVHAPTATVAAAASSQEKALREAWTKTQQSTRDVAAAAKIGKILGERLLIKDIPAVSVIYKKDQRYHGKVRAVIDSLREAGVKLL